MRAVRDRLRRPGRALLWLIAGIYARDYMAGTPHARGSGLAFGCEVSFNPLLLKLEITDFAPRFRNFGRMTKPPQLVRIIEPVSGMPRITIRVRPCNNYGQPIERRTSVGFSA